MKTSLSKNKRLGKALLIYALIFLLLSIIILSFFWFWLKAYEESLPTTAINNYFSSLTLKRIKEMSKDILINVDSSCQSEDDAARYIYDTLINSTPKKDISSSSEDTLVYILTSGDTFIEKIELSKSDETEFGFNKWLVSKEELYGENILSSYSVSLPEGWTVWLNGTQLKCESLKTEYDYLNGFYSEVNNLPYKSTFSFGPYAGVLEFEVHDSNSLSVESSLLNEDYFIKNITGKVKEDVTSFCEKFVQKYVLYSSKGTAKDGSNYYSLINIIEKGSPLYNQIRASLQGFSYASSKGDTILDIRVLECMDIGENRYACKIEYDVQTKGSNSLISTNTYSIRLIVNNSEKSFLASNILFY